MNGLPVKPAQLGVKVFVADRFPDDLERLNIFGALFGREFRRCCRPLWRSLLGQGRPVNKQHEQEENAEGRFGSSATIGAGSLGHGSVVSPIELQNTSGRARVSSAINSDHRSISPMR